MESPLESQPPSSPRRPWSMYIMIAWAIFLAFYTGVLLWDITGPMGQFGSPPNLFGWLSLVIAFVAPFGFGASVYGLWELRPWGRYLFLILSTLYFGLDLLIGVWLLVFGVPPTMQDPTQIRNARLLALARYALALVIPLIYFNLNHIRILFRKSTNQQMDKWTNGHMDNSESGAD